jgi:hypothetical protein
MDAFALAVDGWHDFYLMVGTAAATLTGLLFVSLSLNADAITREANSGLRAQAAETFVSFLNVVMLAVIFLIPRQTPAGPGLPLLAVGAYGSGATINWYLRAQRARPRSWGRGNLARRFAVPMLCYVALVIIAASVLLGRTRGLYWLVPVMILLILGASGNAWELLLRLREPRPKP